MTYEEHNAGVSVEEKLCSLLEKLDKNKKSDLEKKIIGWKFHKRVVSRLKIKNRQGDAEEPEYYYISVACEKPEDFYIFMVLHRTLKYIRNKSNHALEMSSISKESDKKYISIDNVKVAIELYIEYSNKLISYAKSRENKK
jgi:hypothetical protein